MKIRFLFYIFVFCLLFSSCTNSDIQAKQVKSLDSISGALNQKIKELQKADTLILEKALTKFNNYKQFIKQNINDTVTKKEADAVQQFFVSGNNLESFFMNRESILARANLVNSQLNKLIADINQGTFELQQLNEFIFAEKGKTKWFLLTTFFFILSLLSKGQAVVLPILFVVIDFLVGKSGAAVPRESH